MRIGSTAASRAAARRSLLSALLSVLALPVFGAATAFAGPGVTLQQGADGAPLTISGAQIAASANSGPTTYTVRDVAGQPGRAITLRGVTIAGLLQLAGFTPSTVNFVQIVGNGTVITLRSSDINGSPFPEGPALVSDSGGVTRFLRPARSTGGTSDLVESVPGTPLEMTVDGGSLLSILTTATPKRAKVGTTVTFRARVQEPPPGAQFTYTWSFDDGAAGTGAVVTHVYDSGGDYQPRVEVTGSGGSTPRCSATCGGAGKVDVHVIGTVPRPDRTQGTALGGGSSPIGGGSGGTGTGSGTGNGSGSAKSGGGSLTTHKASPKLPRLRAERPEPQTPFSPDPTSGVGETIVQGVLLQGIGKVVEAGLPQSKAGGRPKPQKGTPGTTGQPSNIGIGGVVALAIMWIGALQERRRVRLRLA